MSTNIRSNENGIAMIIALFMLLALSVVGASLMTISQTETDSSHNYRLMSQARYGAESAIHKTTNYLLNTYVPPGTTGNLADPINVYTTTTSPVKWNNQDVVLSSDAAQSNYPVDAVKTAFAAAAQGSLDMKDATVGYKTTATLKSMRQIQDMFSNEPVTIQTWEIAGTGDVTGAKTAEVEVASVLERQTAPLFGFAAFATSDGCNALSFVGGATTDSYDSTHALVSNKPVTEHDWGNVGTNGSLDANGAPTKVWGNLSTPRTGVGACSSGNVTAATSSGDSAVQEDINRLSQPLKYPTPPDPNPMPPLTSVSFKKSDCDGTPNCVTSGNTAIITPVGSTPVVLGNVSISATAELHLNKGTYIMNSLTMNGNATITVDSGPVVIQVVGAGEATPITITGNGVSNPSFKPSDLEIVYAGTGQVKLAGGDQTSALVYAPNATAAITGGSDLYGSIVVKELTEGGGAAIHYDRNLQTTAMTAGNYMMSAFTWKSY